MKKDRQKRAIVRWVEWIQQLTIFLETVKMKQPERAFWNDKLIKARKSLENTNG